MLVRLGKITRAQLEAADRVESGDATTTAARLVAAGVDERKLLDALSDLTRIPVASSDALALAAPMAGLSPGLEGPLREFVAVPIGRIDEGILEVAIADPRTSKRLRAAAIAHKPALALERDILLALDRVFPAAAAVDKLADPTLDSVPLVAPMPVSAVGEPEIVTTTTTIPSRVSAVDDGPTIPPAAVPAIPQPISMPDAEPAPPVSPTPTTAAAAAAPAPQRAEVTERIVKRRTESRRRLPPFLAALAQRARTRPVVVVAAAAAVLVVVCAAAVVCSQEPRAPAPEPRVVGDATCAADGDVPASASGKRAAILCYEQKVFLGDREGVAELERFIDKLAPDDPVRAEAEETLQLLTLVAAPAPITAPKPDPPPKRPIRHPHVDRRRARSSSR